MAAVRGLILLAALLLSPCAVFAQDYISAKTVTPVGPSGGTYLGQGNFIANGQHIPAGYYKAPVNYNPATIGKLAKLGLKGIARFAGPVATLYTILELADWAMTPEGEAVKDSRPEISCGTHYKTVQGITSYACTMTDLSFEWAKAADAWAVGMASQGWTYKIVQYPNFAGCATGNEYWYRYDSYWNGNTYPGTLQKEICQQVIAPYTQPGIAGTPVGDIELYDKIKDDPELVAQVLHDPYGSVHRVPEVVDAETALGDELKQKYAAPAPLVQPGTAIDLGDPNLSPSPETDTSPDSLPAFCTWAKTVCDFIGWVKTPTDHTDVVLPEEELALESYEWSIGLTNSATCPAPFPVDLELMGHSASFEFSLQWLCDLALLLYPVMIGVALWMSAKIIVGLRVV